MKINVPSCSRDARVTSTTNDSSVQPRMTYRKSNSSHFHVLITQKSILTRYSFNTSNIHRYNHRKMKLNVPGCPWDVRGTPTTRASTATANAFPTQQALNVESTLRIVDNGYQPYINHISTIDEDG